MSAEREYRRIAVLGGVYANAAALEATLADVRRRDVDGVFCLGDTGGFGARPERIVPLLREAGVLAIQGNYDAAVAGGLDDCGCGYTDPRDVHFARVSYAYTVARTPTEHRRWLGALPLHRRVRLGDRRLLLCHGSPRAINEFLWESTSPDGLLAALLRRAGADAIVCTHTGLRWHRRVPSGGDLVNVGVVGRPANDGRPGGWYALLTAGPELSVDFVPLDYDHEAVARDVERAGLPAEFAETIRTGWWTTCLEVLPVKERARGRF